MMGKWTEKDDHTLRNLWGGRYSASEIGLELGRSRSAILGRVFRLGMSDKKRATAQQQKHRIEAKRRPARTVPPITSSKPLVRAKIKAPAPLNLLLCDLEPGQCRWPVNTPKNGGEYLFCGHPKHKTSSYCEAHYRASLPEGRRGQ